MLLCYYKEKLNDLIYWSCQVISEMQRRIVLKMFIKYREEELLSVTALWLLLIRKIGVLKQHIRPGNYKAFVPLFLFKGFTCWVEATSMPEKESTISWTSWRDCSCWCKWFQSFMHDQHNRDIWQPCSTECCGTSDYDAHWRQNS